MSAKKKKDFYEFLKRGKGDYLVLVENRDRDKQLTPRNRELFCRIRLVSKCGRISYKTFNWILNHDKNKDNFFTSCFTDTMFTRKQNIDAMRIFDKQQDLVIIDIIEITSEEGL